MIVMIGKFALFAVALVLLASISYWVFLKYRTYQQPWTSIDNKILFRHVGVVAIICLATLAIVGCILSQRVTIKAQLPIKQEYLVNFSVAPQNALSTPLYRLEKYTVGEFEIGKSCTNKKQLTTFSESLGELLGDIKGRFLFGSESWIFVVGGHDEKPLGAEAKKLFETNANLAFSRANCVANEISETLDDMMEMKLMNGPKPNAIVVSGGLRSQPSPTDKKRKYNPSDRVVDVFLYVKDKRLVNDRF